MHNPHGQKRAKDRKMYTFYTLKDLVPGLNINAAVYHCCQYQWSAHRMQANQGGKN